MRYVPGGRLGALYAPASSVTRVREVPLSTFVIVTDAPGINAPDASVMLPRIRPVFPCENAGIAIRKIVNHTPKNKPTFFKSESIRTSGLKIKVRSVLSQESLL